MTAFLQLLLHISAKMIKTCDQNMDQLIFYAGEITIFDVTTFEIDNQKATKTKDKWKFHYTDEI